MSLTEYSPKIESNVSSDDIKTFIRLEALKLAYDIAYKVNNFSRSYDPGSAKFKRDIEDTFKLADINLSYILGKNNKSED